MVHNTKQFRLFWPFMFRIHLWVVVVALVAVSVAGGGAEDIDAIFPPRLAAVLKKVADAKSIPYGAMISGMLALICAFSPAPWVSSIGGHFEPLIMNFKNVGNSGINKTGATRYFDFVFKTVRGALVSLSLDPVKCLARGVQVMKRSIPSFDNTATQAALLQIISLDHNLFGSFDASSSLSMPAVLS